MNDDLSEWPDEISSAKGEPIIRISDLLKDAGWDDDIQRQFGVGDIDEELLDGFDLSIDSDLDVSDKCECSLLRLYSAADDLKEFLQSDRSRFPRTVSQIDSYAFPGGWAYGPWSVYISVPSSVPFDGETGGSIHLFGCSMKGHNCRVILNSDGVVSIRANRPDPETLINNESLVTESEIDGDGVRSDEAREEALYDRRTYSELEEPILELEPEEEIEPFISWREALAPDLELQLFIDKGLEPEEVAQIARLVPRSQVFDWVDLFGTESIMALNYLKIGIGEFISLDELEDINFDELRISIATAIRVAIAEELEKFRNSHRIIAVKKQSQRDYFDYKDEDDFLDLEDDPYWDDEL